MFTYVWRFEYFSVRDIFCLKNFHTFTWTTVRVSKMNAFARAQLTFQMLTLHKKMSIPSEPVLKNMGQQMYGPESSNG